MHQLIRVPQQRACGISLPLLFSMCVACLSQFIMCIFGFLLWPPVMTSGSGSCLLPYRVPDDKGILGCVFGREISSSIYTGASSEASKFSTFSESSEGASATGAGGGGCRELEKYFFRMGAAFTSSSDFSSNVWSPPMSM